MPPKPGFIRPRRGHAVVTLAELMRRSSEYRGLSALAETPEGALAFMREYFLAAPEEASIKMHNWFEWFCRTQSPTPKEQERAAAIVRTVFGG